MRKFKKVVSVCLALIMVTTAGQVVSAQNTNIKAAEVEEEQQAVNLLNKSSRLTDDEAETLVKNIQLELENQYLGEYRFENFCAIFVDVEK
jgi:hypothetical protein